jgi:hypothetical protein
VTPGLPGPKVRLRGAWLNEQGVLWVVGDGVFAKLEGSTWTSLPAEASMSHLEALPGGTLFALSGPRVLQWDGGAWQVAHTATAPLAAALVNGNKLIAVGAAGTVVEGQ